MTADSTERTAREVAAEIVADNDDACKAYFVFAGAAAEVPDRDVFNAWLKVNAGRTFIVNGDRLTVPGF